MKTSKKRPNKQHDARAASFKRIAKRLRARKREIKGAVVDPLTELSRALDDEAKLLRSMR